MALWSPPSFVVKGSFLPAVGLLTSMVTYHLLNRKMADLEIRMAYTDSSFDMLLTSNEELHKLIVVYMKNT